MKRLLLALVAMGLIGCGSSMPTTVDAPVNPVTLMAGSWSGAYGIIHMAFTLTSTGNGPCVSLTDSTVVPGMGTCAVFTGTGTQIITGFPDVVPTTVFAQFQNDTVWIKISPTSFYPY